MLNFSHCSQTFCLFIHFFGFCPHSGKKFCLQDVWENLQALFDSLHAPAHPLRHATLPLPVLREEVPPEV